MSYRGAVLGEELLGQHAFLVQRSEVSLLIPVLVPLLKVPGVVKDKRLARRRIGRLVLQHPLTIGGGKSVLVPTSQFIRTLTAARLAADVCNVPTCIVARTDALGATLMTSDIDDEDKKFVTGERTAEGFYRVKAGLESAIARGLAYAPYADLLWFETSVPDIAEAKEFARVVHAKFPGKYLAYNCSPSFNWEKKLNAKQIASFQQELGALGYKFQFITLAGWHSVNYHMFDLAAGYRDKGMTAYVDLQAREFKREADGYSATRHQREVGTGYFDQVLMTVTGGKAETGALSGSTEDEQFHG